MDCLEIYDSFKYTFYQHFKNNTKDVGEAGRKFCEGIFMINWGGMLV
jgi:hypothetical protein